MSKRVLIVVSSYYPAITADMHRARILAFELPKLGYEVEILTPDESYQLSYAIDNDSKSLFEEATSVHYVGQWMPGLMKCLDINTIGWRSLLPIYREGLRLLKSGKFDLVYFSTTQFLLFCLGRHWLMKTGVPHVFDIHDPWYLPDRKVHTSKKKFKAKLSSSFSKYQESYAFSHAAGVVSVSPDYIDTLRKRYASKNAPWLDEDRTIVCPFAPSSKDFEAIGQNTSSESKIKQIAYVGAGAELMKPSFKYICLLLKETLANKPELRNSIQLTLYGTEGDWNSGETTVIQRLIEELDLKDLIREEPQRIPYSKATRIAAEADGLFVLGVDDPAYMPSKLFTYMITGKPLLASMCKSSVATKLFDKKGNAGHVVEFGENPNTKDIAAMDSFLSEVISGKMFDRTELLNGYLASDMAKAHAKLFDRCINN